MDGDNIIIFNPNNFDINRVAVRQVTNDSIPIRSIKIDNRTPAILTDPIRITSYGIPKPNSTINIPVEHILIGLDPQQLSTCHLKTHLNEVDNYFSSDQFKIELFGDKYKKYKYYQLVRDCRERTNNMYKNEFPFCKIKFSKKINTKIIENSEKIKINTIEDILKYIKFGSTYQFTFIYSKLWIGNREYGISLIMKEILSINSIQLPMYDIETIKMTYKKYMDERRSNKKIKLIEI